jgi:hypothetical protein
MSNHFFSVNHGLANFDNNFAITQATSSTSGDDIELRVADGVGLTRLDVLKALEQLEHLFQSGGSAPGGTTFPSASAS